MKILKSRPLIHFHNREAYLGFWDRIFLRGEIRELGFYRRMFDEDFSSIFHYSNRRSGTLFDVTTNDEEVTERLLASIDTGYGPHGSDQTILKWVEEIAESLIWSGKAYYYLLDASDSDRIRISPFGPRGVLTFLSVTIQWVPRLTERHWDREDEEKPREVRILDGQKVLCFTMPKKLRQILRSQNKTLATLDRYQYETTKFLPQATHEDPNPMSHFDFKVWSDNQDRALYRATRQTGWNGRKHDGAKRSDFFDCHRQIRFRRNQILLRDDILRQIGSELTRVGREYGAEYSLRIAPTDALPQVEQLDDLESRLMREDASFTEVIDFCLKA